MAVWTCFYKEWESSSERSYITTNELSSLKESVSRIEKFAVGFPRKVECPDRWRDFFEWQYQLCVSRAKELGINTVAEKNAVLGL